MGVGIAEDSTGRQITLISTSEANGYLRKGVTLNENEVLVKGQGDIHAEVDIVNYCKDNNLDLISIGATRPVCPNCVETVASTGAEISTPLKK
jgi:filamentous hemagglutinin